MGGRLVFFLPSVPDSFEPEAELPRHPALVLRYTAEQLLTTRYSRRLVTMEKARARARLHCQGGGRL